MKCELKDYKAKLKKELADCLGQPIGTRSMEAVNALIECWEHVNDMERCICHGDEFTAEDAEQWNNRMKNEDGSTGGHWTVEQTTEAAKGAGVIMEHVTPEMWNVAMNMMYSDYSGVAQKNNCNKAEFYAEMAKAFLFDKDGPGPEEKLSAYYHGIVEE